MDLVEMKKCRCGAWSNEDGRGWMVRLKKPLDG